MLQTGIRRLLLAARPAGALLHPLRPYAASRPALCAASPEPQLPPNLKLQDASILQTPERPPLAVDPQAYVIGTLRDLPSLQLPVRSFADPSQPPAATYSLDKRVFTVPIRKDIVLEVIRYQRAWKRQPKKTKRMSEVSGSGKKPWRQKGTGRARAGHLRAPQRKKGAKAHGPVLRDYSISLNKKYRALGLMIALAAKFREGNLVLVDKLALDSIKTKDFEEIWEKHGLTNVHTLLLDQHEVNPYLFMAARNVPTVEYTTQQLANVYSVVKTEKIVTTPEALRDLETRLLRQHLGKRAFQIEQARSQQA